jgi:hypothetical protein
MHRVTWNLFIYLILENNERILVTFRFWGLHMMLPGKINFDSNQFTHLESGFMQADYGMELFSKYN